MLLLVPPETFRCHRSHPPNVRRTEHTLNPHYCQTLPVPPPNIISLQHCKLPLVFHKRLRKMRNLLLPPNEEVQWLSGVLDRKSTRLNSSHGYISYAVFC